MFLNIFSIENNKSKTHDDSLRSDNSIEDVSSFSLLGLAPSIRTKRGKFTLTLSFLMSFEEDNFSQWGLPCVGPVEDDFASKTSVYFFFSVAYPNKKHSIMSDVPSMGTTICYSNIARWNPSEPMGKPTSELWIRPSVIHRYSQSSSYSNFHIQYIVAKARNTEHGHNPNLRHRIWR